MHSLPSPTEAARRLGGRLVGPGRILAPGPGHSAEDRSLSILLKPDAPEGFIVNSFAGDDPIVCRDHIREILGLRQWSAASVRPIKPRPLTPAERDTIAAALHLWSATRPARGTRVEKYLASRGLTFDAALSDVIRFDVSTGAMVCLFRDLQSDQRCGVHRTFLDAEGHKVDRKMLGRVKAAAIKLDADCDVTLGLHVGEGIETCLSARQAGFRPVWALGSAGAIATFPVLAGAEAVTVFAEHDDGGANSRAIEQCGERLEAAGIEVGVIDPPHAIGDLNDLLDGRQS